MKLLPPKPPKSAGTDAELNKKTKEVTDISPDTGSSDKKLGNDQTIKNNLKSSNKLEDEINELPPELPLMASTAKMDMLEDKYQAGSADQSMVSISGTDEEDEKSNANLYVASDMSGSSVNGKLSAVAVPEKKEKGFLSRLFGKKEKNEKGEAKAKEDAPSELPSIMDNNLNNNLDNLSNSLGNLNNEVKDNDENEIPESISAADDDFVQEIQALPVDESYAEEKPKSKNKIDSVSEPNESLSWVDDVTAGSKLDSAKSVTKSVKKERSESTDEWTNDVGGVVGAVSKGDDAKADISDKGQKGKESKQGLKKSESKKEMKKDSKAPNVEGKKEMNKEESSSEWVSPVEMKKGEMENSETTSSERVDRTISDEADFASQTAEWKSKSVAIAVKENPNTVKDIKKLDVRLKKILKVYESKISKVAAVKKKEVQFEIREIARKNKEIEQKKLELAKKEKAVSERDKKLSELEVSITSRKKELDALVSQEASLKSRKDALEKDIAEYKKTVAGLKAEVLNNQKLVDAQRNTISLEKKSLQDELKKLKDAAESEKVKGEKKLAELAKKVESTQAELDEMQEKDKIYAEQRKKKELELRQKEREINALIMQEKKIISLLKNNELHAAEFESISRRSGQQSVSPATIIGNDGQPEIFIGDKEALNQKINDCKELIKEENFEDAKIVYNEIRDSFVSARLDENTKMTIRHEMRELYDDICLRVMSKK